MLEQLLMSDRMMKLLPQRFRLGVPVVPVVCLSGTIGAVGPLKSGLSLDSVGRILEKAFSVRKAVSVAIVVNSPGGSPVQSRLIFKKIRDLSIEHKLPVYVFCEDVAASGGYMLALSGDEIYADPSSIIGSIGVLSGSFGFNKLLKKIGVERRVYTAGAKKMMLDMFQPEQPEEVEHLRGILDDLHEIFKNIVRDRRAEKLCSDSEEDLFSGAFWTGEKAVQLGLIDGLGDMHTVLREKYGEKVVLRKMSTSRTCVKRLMGSRSDLLDGVIGVIDEVEKRALWSRFGL